MVGLACVDRVWELYGDAWMECVKFKRPDCLKALVCELRKSVIDLAGAQHERALICKHLGLPATADAQEVFTMIEVLKDKAADAAEGEGNV